VRTILQVGDGRPFLLMLDAVNEPRGSVSDYGERALCPLSVMAWHTAFIRKACSHTRTKYIRRNSYVLASNNVWLQRSGSPFFGPDQWVGAGAGRL